MDEQIKNTNMCADFAFLGMPNIEMDKITKEIPV
jgi:hypothetical protein